MEKVWGQSLAGNKWEDQECLAWTQNLAVFKYLKAGLWKRKQILFKSSKKLSLAQLRKKEFSGAEAVQVSKKLCGNRVYTSLHGRFKSEVTTKDSCIRTHFQNMMSQSLNYRHGFLKKKRGKRRCGLCKSLGVDRDAESVLIFNEMW